MTDNERKWKKDVLTTLAILLGSWTIYSRRGEQDPSTLVAVALVGAAFNVKLNSL